MNLLFNTKFFNAIPPGIIKDNAAFVSNVIDKQTFLEQGAKGLLFVIQLGATDIALATMIVKQSDTKTDATTLGGSPTTVKDSAAKPSATDDDGIAVIYVSMEKWTNRFLQLQSTAGNGTNGTYLSALCIADMAGDGAGTVASLNAISLDIA